MIFENVGPLTIIIILVVFAVTMALGRTVQAKTHFIWPHDLISIAVIAASVVYILLILFVWGLSAAPVHPYLFPFVWLGYFGGFFLSSRKKYLHLNTMRGIMSASIMHDEIQRMKFMRKFTKKRIKTGMYFPYVVPYQIGTTWYIRRQTNSDLIKDWLFGIRCEVETNGDLKAVREAGIDHPWFPIPRIEYLPVEVFEIKCDTVKMGRFKMKMYSAVILIAPAGMATNEEMNMNLAAHQRDIYVVHKAKSDMFKAQFEIPNLVADQLAKSVSAACLDSAPGMQIYDACKELERLEKEEGKPKPGESDNVRMLRRLKRRST